MTLTVNQLPSHRHQLRASNDVANQTTPASDRVPAQAGTFDLYHDQNPVVNMNTSAVTMVGGSRSHTNLMPFLCIHFIIALFGIYPSRH